MVALSWQVIRAKYREAVWVLPRGEDQVAVTLVLSCEASVLMPETPCLLGAVPLSTGWALLGRLALFSTAAGDHFVREMEPQEGGRPFQRSPNRNCTSVCSSPWEHHSPCLTLRRASSPQFTPLRKIHDLPRVGLHRLACHSSPAT